jgi:hypothetical protein
MNYAKAYFHTAWTAITMLNIVNSCAADSKQAFIHVAILPIALIGAVQYIHATIKP